MLSKVEAPRNDKFSHSLSLEMARIVIPSGTRGIFPPVSSFSRARVKLMNHFVVNSFFNRCDLRLTQSSTLLSLKALLITETELNVIATLAITGLSKMPKNG